MQTVPVMTPRPMSMFRAIFVRRLSLAFQRRITGKAAPVKSVRMEKTPCAIIIFSTAGLGKQ